MSHCCLGKKMSDLFILIAGYVIVNVLSLVIAARVRKHLSVFYASFTHVFVILVAVYYVVDLLTSPGFPRTTIYFYFWLLIILTQTVLFFLFRRSIQKSKSSERRGRVGGGD